jgi:hypothetical protein
MTCQVMALRAPRGEHSFTPPMERVHTERNSP